MLDLFKGVLRLFCGSSRMRVFVALILLLSATAVEDGQPGVGGKTNFNHTLTYWYTATAGVNTSTKVVGSGLIDGNPFYRYDNDSWRERKPVWMRKLVENPFWANQAKSQVDSLRDLIAFAKQNFDRSAESYTVQLRLGCERDGQTRAVKTFLKYGYDGEAFMEYDLKHRWIPLSKSLSALHFQRKWNHNKNANTMIRQFLTETCPDWLQNNSIYLERIGGVTASFPRFFFMKLYELNPFSVELFICHHSVMSSSQASRHTRCLSVSLSAEFPSVSLLQKNHSSPITCLATGFYPDRALLFWRRDGEELHEGVNVPKILPNHDGSFQIRAHLDPPSDDWQRYECVFNFPGVKKDVVTNLDEADVKSNSGSHEQRMGATIIIAASLGVGLILPLLVLGLWNRERLRECLPGARNASNPPAYDSVSTKSDSHPPENEKSGHQMIVMIPCDSVNPETANTRNADSPSGDGGRRGEPTSTTIQHCR